jgi:hypothetical protein
LYLTRIILVLDGPIVEEAAMRAFSEDQVAFWRPDLRADSASDDSANVMAVTVWALIGMVMLILVAMSDTAGEIGQVLAFAD